MHGKSWLGDHFVIGDWQNIWFKAEGSVCLPWNALVSEAQLGRCRTRGLGFRFLWWIGTCWLIKANVWVVLPLHYIYMPALAHVEHWLVCFTSIKGMVWKNASWNLDVARGDCSPWNFIYLGSEKDGAKSHGGLHEAQWVDKCLQHSLWADLLGAYFWSWPCNQKYSTSFTFTKSKCQGILFMSVTLSKFRTCNTGETLVVTGMGKVSTWLLHVKGLLATPKCN